MGIGGDLKADALERRSAFCVDEHTIMARRREAEAKLARFADAIKRAAETKNPTQLREVWGDPDFMAYVAGTLARIKQLEQDSADLQVIARVFGGSAR